MLNNIKELPRIFFMHIPKTGGTTINTFFKSIYPSDDYIDHFENTFIKSKSIDLKYRFISGHIPIDRISNQLGTREYLKFTVLRNPVEQLTSHINWVIGISENPKSQFFLGHPAPVRNFSMNLRKIDFSNTSEINDFFSKLRNGELNLFNNNQTRYLLPNLSGQAIRIEHFETALSNLKRFDEVGLLKNLNGFKNLVSKKYLSIPKVTESISTQNANPLKFIDNITVKSCEVLMSLIEIDNLVYSSIEDSN